MLVYRCAPASSRVLRAWRASPATSASLAETRPAPGSPPPQPRDGAAHEASPARARRERRRISPKSFLYHFAVEALLPLI